MKKVFSTQVMQKGRKGLCETHFTSLEHTLNNFTPELSVNYFSECYWIKETCTGNSFRNIRPFTILSQAFRLSFLGCCCFSLSLPRAPSPFSCFLHPPDCPRHPQCPSPAQRPNPLRNVLQATISPPDSSSHVVGTSSSRKVHLAKHSSWKKTKNQTKSKKNRLRTRRLTLLSKFRGELLAQQRETSTMAVGEKKEQGRLKNPTLSFTWSHTNRLKKVTKVYFSSSCSTVFQKRSSYGKDGSCSFACQKWRCAAVRLCKIAGWTGQLSHRNCIYVSEQTLWEVLSYSE